MYRMIDISSVSLASSVLPHPQELTNSQELFQLIISVVLPECMQICSCKFCCLFPETGVHAMSTYSMPAAADSAADDGDDN